MSIGETNNTSWVAYNDCIIRDLPSYNGSRTDHGTLTYSNSCEYRCISTHRRTFRYKSLGKLLGIHFTSWEKIICESRIWPNKNIVINSQTVPNLNTAFYCNSVTNNNIVFNKYMIANITIFTNFSAWKYMCKSPNPSIVTDIQRLNQGIIMFKKPHITLLVDQYILKTGIPSFSCLKKIRQNSRNAVLVKMLSQNTAATCFCYGTTFGIVTNNSFNGIVKLINIAINKQFLTNIETILEVTYSIIQNDTSRSCRIKSSHI
ncbi:hypothetical protein DSOUD_1681 [Desulfuromonas soudanensis]|uniref:Uncharacterized protein n=1 Tax=Desulfuromonas soudanensis TaxID=1603606 RepID=A0A0M3QFL9_9BACT|nr:hypothetical protein DSOUD_1681 [Desulfuromonas soudanensis]